MSSYKTISGVAEGLYKEKGSKFFAYLHPIETEEQAKELLKNYKKKYYDARHHCYALILGTDMKLQKYSDDGEPAHTAGTPILNKLKSYELCNVICIVVRFFGGTKLGVPGLIEAYKGATEAALLQANIIEQEIKVQLWLNTDYLSVNEVMRAIKATGALLLQQNYNEADIDIEVSLSQGKKQEFIDLLIPYYKVVFPSEL